MLNKGQVIVSFECSDWLAKQVDLLADYKTAANPRGGQVTRADMLQEIVFNAVMSKMDRTGGRLKLRRPPPAHTQQQG